MACRQCHIQNNLVQFCERRKVIEGEDIYYEYTFDCYMCGYKETKRVKVGFLRKGVEHICQPALCPLCGRKAEEHLLTAL